MLVFFPGRYTLTLEWFIVLALYVLAKFCEHSDVTIYDLTDRFVSGHTVKHLLAAAATVWVLRILVAASRAVLVPNSM
jgi:hypothetical protein